METPRTDQDFQDAKTKHHTDQFTKRDGVYISHAEAARGCALVIGSLIAAWLLMVVFHCVLGAVL